MIPVIPSKSSKNQLFYKTPHITELQIGYALNSCRTYLEEFELIDYKINLISKERDSIVEVFVKVRNKNKLFPGAINPESNTLP